MFKDDIIMEKKLYPFKFIPIASRRPWGSHQLVSKMGKVFVECDEEGNETVLGSDEKIGESWELSDMGENDSVVSNGWLAGNTIGELMETYLERIVGEKVYNYYGRQFPLLIKLLDINDRLSVQVHPDDKVAAERYDSLGKAEIWYILDAAPDAKIYAGFTKEMTAQELYDRCKNGSVEEVLNVIHPKKGDALMITPGTVHAADGGILVLEVQESSDMTFRLYDWGREFNPATARTIHLDEAIDVIDYSVFDQSNYMKGNLWKNECDCKEGECHCHEDKVAEVMADRPEFCVTKLNLTDPLHIYTEQFESFIVYSCAEGSATIQVPSTKENGESYMETYHINKGETVLVPAEMPDFFLVPGDRDTILLEATCRPEETDEYINPDTEAFLEDEDYEGLEDGLLDDDEDKAQSGASPLGFFGAGNGPLS